MLPHPAAAPERPAKLPGKPGGQSTKYMIIISLAIVAGLGWWLWQKQLSQINRNYGQNETVIVKAIHDLND